jgi:kynurenine formamidase
MMEMNIVLGSKRYRVDLDSPVSLAIPLAFNGPQPSFFGAPPATAAPLKVEGFVGDTRKGGSCNVAELRLVPHCNGTHTESVGHLVHEAPPIAELLLRTLFPARLITVIPSAADETPDGYRPAKQTADRLITRDALDKALHEDLASAQSKALLVRTLPNDESKKHRRYGGLPCRPPFFSIEAIDYLTERGIEHLLVDFPSLDKMYDEGRLTNHHRFWNVPERHQALTSETQIFKTVTEMIFVPDHIQDGLYLLDLQIPAFLSDAAPCRPIIYPLEPESNN